jgi:hypothetical protein
MARASLPKIPTKHKPGKQQSKPKWVKLLVSISDEAKENLEELRLRSLAKNGRKPGRSEIVNKLLTAALQKEKIPYPNR